MKNQINQDSINQYYESIYNTTTSSIKKRNLKIIYDILVHQFNSSENNFTIAHIGRLSKQNGGPSTQAIRNKQGKDYRYLIKYFEDNVIIKNSNKPINEEINTLIDYIEDNTLKAHINIILAENKSLKSQLNILKKNMSKNYEFNYIKNSDYTEEKGNTINYTLNSSEIDAIKKFVKNIEKEQCPLYKTKSGAIKDENDVLVANPGFFTGINKILLDLENK